MEAKRIILADDDDDCFLIEAALEEAGVSPPARRVRDGAELLALLRKWSGPALVLLDLNMPGMSGRQALTAIKQDAAFAHVHVVVLSTSRSEEDAALARRWADGHWRKPERYAELVDVARRLRDLFGLTIR
ncbi:MAG: response regulator [Elusimicrobia bacterium]|nr:response regulator [Elusimicrobiota bacterium]